MTDRELLKLSRVGLLRILRDQEREIDALKGECQSWKSKALERKLQMRDAGNLAQASVMVTHLFEESRAAFDRILESAQEAADLYMENLRDMRPAVPVVPETVPDVVESVTAAESVAPVSESIALVDAHDVDLDPVDDDTDEAESLPDDEPMIDTRGLTDVARFFQDVPGSDDMTDEELDLSLATSEALDEADELVDAWEEGGDT